MGEPTTTYVPEIGVGCRLRVQIWDGPELRFAIALEYEWADDDWRRVVCFDNWGGVVHRDRYKPNGKHYTRHENVFDSADIHRAIAWATKDIHDNLGAYVKDFRRLGARRR